MTCRSTVDADIAEAFTSYFSKGCHRMKHQVLTERGATSIVGPGLFRMLLTQTRNRVLRVPLAAAVMLMLCACPVHLVSDYDDQIDIGLTQLNTDVTIFVNRMIKDAGKPEGAYESNADFYTIQGAKVESLIVRAEAHKVLDSCPSSQVIVAAVKSNLPTTQTFSAGLPVPDAESVLNQMKKDDCSVVLLTLIKTALDQLETLHKAQGSKGIPAAAHDPILIGGLGSLIRGAITVEVALKSGKSAGGSSGT